jgi:hypothetical protein
MSSTMYREDGEKSVGCSHLLLQCRQLSWHENTYEVLEIHACLLRGDKIITDSRHGFSSNVSHLASRFAGRPNKLCDNER